ncbi:hypothetical protein NEFER03_1247, partial [Nematocida sp. LUAm3]
MQKIRSNRSVLGVIVLATSFLLMLGLSQATLDILSDSNWSINDSSLKKTHPKKTKKDSSSKDTRYLSEHAQNSLQEEKNIYSMYSITPLEFTFNSLKKNERQSQTNNELSLIFTSKREFKTELLRLLNEPNIRTIKNDVVSHALHKSIYNIQRGLYKICLKNIFTSFLKQYESHYPHSLLDYMDIDYIISNSPGDYLTGKEAAYYLVEFLNLVDNYLRNVQKHMEILEAFKSKDSLNASDQHSITSATNLLNLLFVHNRFVVHCREDVTNYQYIFDRINFSKSEKKHLIRHWEFVLSCLWVGSNDSMCQDPNTKARLEETKKEFSDECVLMKNYYSIYLLYVALFDSEQYLKVFENWFLENQRYTISLDKQYQGGNNNINSVFSKLPAIKNTISLQDIGLLYTDKLISTRISNIILFFGTEGTIEIEVSSDCRNILEYRQLKKNIKDLLLNSTTKVMFRISRTPQIEEILNIGHRKERLQRENIIAQLTKKEDEPKRFTLFFWIGVISTFGLFVLSIFTKAAAAILPILLPVIIFTFALFVLYTLSQKENKIRRTSILRGVPIAAIAFLTLYIISTFVITDMNGNPLILKTVQFLLLSEFSLVVLFGVIASGLIIKSVGHIKKRFRARLALRIVIYALS